MMLVKKESRRGLRMWSSAIAASSDVSVVRDLGMGWKSIEPGCWDEEVREGRAEMRCKTWPKSLEVRGPAQRNLLSDIGDAEH